MSKISGDIKLGDIKLGSSLLANASKTVLSLLVFLPSLITA